MKTSKNLAAALKTLFVVVAVPFVAVACCSDIEDPDDQLMIEVAADADTDVSPAACDADVVAIDDDGEEIALEPQVRGNSDGSERCVYVGTVNPHKLYSVEVQREDKVGFVQYAQSNPGCSIATDPNDTDNVLELRALPEVARLRGQPTTTSPVAERDITL